MNGRVLCSRLDVVTRVAFAIRPRLAAGGLDKLPKGVAPNVGWRGTHDIAVPFPQKGLRELVLELIT